MTLIRLESRNEILNREHRKNVAARYLSFPQSSNVLHRTAEWPSGPLADELRCSKSRRPLDFGLDGNFESPGVLTAHNRHSRGRVHCRCRYGRTLDCLPP